MESRDESLVTQTRSTLFTVAAFFYAFAIFLCIQKAYDFSPDEAVAVGRVTIDRASKAYDYTSFATFLIVCTAGTLLLRIGGIALFRRLRRGRRTDDATRYIDTLCFTLPFLSAPFFFLTTRKEGWALVLPLLLSCSLLAARRKWRATAWLRELYSERMLPFHALLILEAASWITFRYLVTGTRIAHIPTLFLEIFFVVFFVALFELAATVIARLASLLTAAHAPTVFGRVALAASPLLLLPFAGLLLQPFVPLFLAVVALVFVSVPLVRRITELRPERVRRFLIAVAIPAFLFAFSYAANAAPSWFDLFHRGETLGPASDYLRGKVPYRDVFVLHGLLEDGLLDAWLMQLFGRDAAVSVARTTVIAALTLPLLFLIGTILFESIPLALLTAALGTVTFVDNQRLILHLAVIAALLHWCRSASRRALFASGVFTGLAIFYSLDIGLFALAGAFTAIAVIHLMRREKSEAFASLALHAAGTLAGSAPFLLYLAARGALGDFFHTSFLVVPRIIDAVWSLPYPNLGAPFRSDLSLRSLADFLLGEQMRFILNPLIIVIALIVIAFHWRARTIGRYTEGLVVLAAAAAFAQRSALGRADFRHQYFAAYLLAPLAMILALLAVRRFRATTRGSTHFPFRTLAAGVVLLLSFVVLWIPDLLNAKIDGVVTYRPRLSQVGYEDRAGELVRERIGRLTYFASSVTTPSDSIFDFSNQPALYFFLNRPNATRFYQVPIISPLELEREALRSLDREKPKLVIRRSPEGFDQFDGIPNEVRTPSLARYLDQQYEFWRSAAGVELWRRRGGIAPVRLPDRLVVPKQVRQWAEEALILPGVGSVTGAGGAEWRADLVLHNPHDEPLVLHLRYSADRRTVDRNVTVAPYRTEIRKDVAANLFGLASSRGAIFVRYPQHRRPIVTVQSYDRTRPQSRTTATALSSLQAARSGTSHYALSLVGIEQRHDQRINLGVINVGSGPLRIRIVCRTPWGEVVGLPVRTVVDEAQSYSLVNAPVALGVPFSGGVTVHIDVLAGSAVAYASIIDSATGGHQTIEATPSGYKR